MKSKTRYVSSITAISSLSRPGIVLVAALVALACRPACAREDGDRDGEYHQTNLIADLPGVALLQDTNLVNAWGLSFSATSPFWISDNGSGLATVYAVTYDTNGTVQVVKQGVQAGIPGDGTPTGQLFNGTTAFHTNVFIFASEDGTLSGWRPGLGGTAETLVTRDTAVYKGITLVAGANGPELLAANFAEGTLDAYGGDLNLLAQYADPAAPAGYAPFNVQSVGGMVFVTFARQDAAKHDDVPGPGHGLIDVFDLSTGTFHRFATGKDAGGRLREINSPWGLALSPTSFGGHADQLLVGNFGSGTIMSFDAHMRFQGLLESRHERPIVIDGLWGLAFGNGGRAGRPSTLYFTSGPNGEGNGLFGALDPVAKHKRDEDHDGHGKH